jgi:glycerophosphoryl diester phosphodiesterase
MYVTAHRGFGDRYPENTVEAVTQASEDADAVEIDVRRCGSGELVVTHYDHLALVTDGHGDVNELSAAEVTSFTIEGSSECIPRLDAVLDAIPRTPTSTSNSKNSISQQTSSTRSMTSKTTS